jgi:hypothetical protein
MKSSTKKTAPRRSRAVHSREAKELMETYRELGFVYSGFSAPRRADGNDFGLQQMDPRPRVDLTFSALSVP